jgi:uncharacterized membrane protein
MAKQASKTVMRAEQHLRTRLIAGVLVVVPIGLTVWILNLLFEFLDDLLPDIVETLTPWNWDPPAGVGIGITIALVYVVGLVAANFLGRRLVTLMNNFLDHVPIVKTVYTAIRQVVEAFSGKGKVKFNRVVMLDWPRPGVKSLGFVTGQVVYKGNQRLISVYLPTTPNPTAGFLALVPEEELIDTDMTVEEGIKMLISGGIISPEGIRTEAAQQEASSPK